MYTLPTRRVTTEESQAMADLGARVAHNAAMRAQSVYRHALTDAERAGEGLPLAEDTLMSADTRDPADCEDTRVWRNVLSAHSVLLTVVVCVVAAYLGYLAYSSIVLASMPAGIR